MKYIITQNQLKLLNQNFVIFEEGLSSLEKNMISESGMPVYIVSMWIAGYTVEIRIGTTTGSGGAITIARKMFPKANVYSAKSA